MLRFFRDAFLVGLGNIGTAVGVFFMLAFFGLFCPSTRTAPTSMGPYILSFLTLPNFLYNWNCIRGALLETDARATLLWYISVRTFHNGLSLPFETTMANANVSESCG